MNWFWKWLHRRIERSLKEETQAMNKYGNGICVAIDDSPQDRKMNFTVTAAEGGVIYRQNVYDRKTDRSSERVVLIHDNEDLGERVGQLVTMGMMQV